MSTFPTDPVAGAGPANRRRFARHRVTSPLPIRVARGEGVAVDLGIGGARIRHSGALLRGTRTRLKLLTERPLWIHCVVLASRVVDLGTPTTPTTYETRLRFDALAWDEKGKLEELIATLETRDLRRFVANLRGWNEQPPHQPVLPTSTFVRLSRDGNSWSRKLTTSSRQPPDGFTLPASTDPNEIEMLCRTWEKLDADGRHVVHCLATEAVNQAIPQ